MIYNLHIYICQIEADSEADAKKEAYHILENYAGSNDGSELLANATAILSLKE